MKNWMRAGLLWVTTAFSAAPGLSTVLVLTTLIASAVAPLSVLGITQTIGAATEGTSLWPGVTLTAISLVLGSLSGAIAGPIGDTVDDKLYRHVHHDVMRVVGSIPSLAHHENHEVADRIQLVRQDVWRLQGIFRLLGVVGAITGGITVVAMLVRVHPLLLLLLLAACVPTAVGALGWSRQLSVNKELVKYWRVGQELIDVLIDPKRGLEVRCFGMRRPLLRVTRHTLEALNKPLAKLVDRFGRVTMALWLLYGFVHLAALWWIITRARHGQATVADASLVLLIGPQIATVAMALTTNVRTVQEALVAFDRYRWLRDYSASHQWHESTISPPERLVEGIRFEGVGFSYPAQQGKDEPVTALAGVDLVLPAGTSVALVGANGAGKSTLVKLLARFYDPTEGRILVDGVPLTDIDPRAWRHRMSAGFQDFAKLEFLVRESIGVGDLAHQHDGDRLSRAARSGQAEGLVSSLSDGLETQLGTRFDGGRDLSGGQWQRLALSRAFMREAPLVMLLDEPTAALDPEAEHDIYDQYARTAKALAAQTGAVTVLVSHRFSTVRMADLIVVLDDSRISEIGTHTELLASGGRYAEMFHLQAAAYR